MPVFRLFRDEKFETWWRDYYEIEAESEKEAVKIINEGNIDPYYSEAFPDPSAPTIKSEIYNQNGDLLYESE